MYRYEDVPLKTKQTFETSNTKISVKSQFKIIFGIFIVGYLNNTFYIIFQSELFSENNKQSKSFFPPKSINQKKHVNLTESPKNVPKANGSLHQPSYTSSVLPKLIEKEEGKINIAGVNINVNSTVVSDENEINDCKFKNLTILQNPCIDVKPDFITQKLADIQIVSDRNKSLW